MDDVLNVPIQDGLNFIFVLNKGQNKRKSRIFWLFSFYFIVLLILKME